MTLETSGKFNYLCFNFPLYKINVVFCVWDLNCVFGGKGRAAAVIHLDLSKDFDSLPEYIYSQITKI